MILAASWPDDATWMERERKRSRLTRKGPDSNADPDRTYSDSNQILRSVRQTLRICVLGLMAMAGQ